jgi:hypothetical protein
MLPAIFPGSNLYVDSARPEDLRPGDVACYLGKGNVVVAHRVVCGPSENGEDLIVKGDSQPEPENLPRSAVMYKVMRVEHRFLSYDTDGILGSSLARMALSNGRIARGLQKAMLAGISLAVVLRGILRRG